MKPLPRWQEALVVLVLTALATFAPSESAFADVARARKLAETAMTHFQQKKYMAAVRFHGQAIGALPTDKAHQQRAE